MVGPAWIISVNIDHLNSARRNEDAIERLFKILLTSETYKPDTIDVNLNKGEVILRSEKYRISKSVITQKLEAVGNFFVSARFDMNYQTQEEMDFVESCFIE